eukprot:Gregarina_sp_Poly_1__9812@NODE_628_length_7065_cov_56_119891_g481_i0_p8_GENE_NODE_628_length_7065_cov_56_119891_g481_i0NODE_628_length_7065_cov_56_119891_g481_i0_p8_ORF_typecomplete_len104_score8_74_NODE_628_length_7065_cov_56_119891_g481_i055395850
MRKTSGLTPVTRDSEESLQTGPVYGSVDVGSGQAPLVYAGSLTRIQHEPHCQRNFHLHHHAAPQHTTRGFCHCMSSFEIDKQVCLELLSRELAIDAFFFACCR